MCILALNSVTGFLNVTLTLTDSTTGVYTYPTHVLQVYSVRVRVNIDHALGLLLEKEQFNITRKYAELVNSTKSQISIKEVGTLYMHG